MDKADKKTMINGAKVVDRHTTPEIEQAIDALLGGDIDNGSKPFLRTGIKVITTLAKLIGKEEGTKEVMDNIKKIEQ